MLPVHEGDPMDVREGDPMDVREGDPMETRRGKDTLSFRDWRQIKGENGPSEKDQRLCSCSEDPKCKSRLSFLL